MKCVREAVWGPGETPDSAYQVGAGMAEQVISPQAAAGEERTSHKVDKKKKGSRRSKTQKGPTGRFYHPARLFPKLGSPICRCDIIIHHNNDDIEGDIIAPFNFMD